MLPSNAQLQWFVHQLTCAFEAFLERPAMDRKGNLVGLLEEYQEAVKLGHIELPRVCRAPR